MQRGRLLVVVFCKGRFLPYNDDIHLQQIHKDVKQLWFEGKPSIG